MESANAQALSLIGAVDPVFTGLALAREVIDLEGRYLLHAGPPISAENLPIAVLNSAAVAALFEGWADTARDARDLVRGGDIKLVPAQDHAAVVPLASVLSPSMRVQCVSDRHNGDLCAYSPINGGGGPALRLGLCTDAVLAHLEWLNGDFADWFSSAVGTGGIPLIPLADHGLEQGDDCHGRTGAATARLTEILMREPAGKSADDAIVSFLRDGPSFFLNLWMAATRCMLSAAIGVKESSVITAIGGNGIDFGLQIAARPGSWVTTPASVPDGVYDTGYSAADGIGAIGDSAVVDTFGLGAMAVAFSPAQASALDPVLPAGVQRLPAMLLGAVHRGFVRVSPLYGLAAQRVVDKNVSPVIALGIIDRTGVNGRVGGGIYRPPVSLFADAMALL
jgi:hypothetical protein